MISRRGTKLKCKQYTDEGLDRQQRTVRRYCPECAHDSIYYIIHVCVLYYAARAERARRHSAKTNCLAQRQLSFLEPPHAP
jgi:hypothetical protein